MWVVEEEVVERVGGGSLTLLHATLHKGRVIDPAAPTLASKREEAHASLLVHVASGDEVHTRMHDNGGDVPPA